MDNMKNDTYYLSKIITDLEFIVKTFSPLTQKELEESEVLTDSIMFRLIQLSENSNKLSEKFKTQHNSVPWRAIKGMRNKIVHEYGDVDLSVVYNTVKNDIPYLLKILKATIS